MQQGSALSNGRFSGQWNPERWRIGCNSVAEETCLRDADNCSDWLALDINGRADDRSVPRQSPLARLDS